MVEPHVRRDPLRSQRRIASRLVAITLIGWFCTACPTAELSPDAVVDGGQDVADDSTVADQDPLQDPSDVADIVSSDSEDQAGDTPDPSLAPMIVSEIQVNPCEAALEVGQWVELANVSLDSIDLAGYSLSDSAGNLLTFAADEPLLVAPGSFLVVGNALDFETVGQAGGTYVYTEFLLDAQGAELSLNDPNMRIVDVVDFDEGWWNEERCGSLQLSADRFDGGANDIAESWCVTPGAFDDPDPATAGADNLVCGNDFCGDGVTGETERCDDGLDNSDVVANACRTDCTPPSCGDGVRDDDDACDEGENGSDTCTAACADLSEAPDQVGQVIITEIMHSADEGDNGNFVEIYNTTGRALNLAGCVFHNRNEWTLPGPRLRIEVDQYLSIGVTAGDPVDERRFVSDIAFGAAFRVRSADTISISCDGLLLDEVVYDSALGWPNRDEASMSLGDDTLQASSNDDFRNWCTSENAYGNGDNRGSPGQRNAACPDRLIDECRYVRPPNATVFVDETVTVFTSIVELGITDLTSGIDSSDEIVVEVGVGPDGVHPSDPEWVWSITVGTDGWSNQDAVDQYHGDIDSAAPGLFDMAGRASRDSGQSWTYCDLDTGEPGYQPENSGSLTVSARDDVSATVTSSDSLAEPATIDSIAGAATPTAVFDFVVSDGGGSDGLPTLVDSLTIRVAGSLDAAEHDWTLESSAFDAITAVVGGEPDAQTLTFDTNISIDHATSEVLTLLIQLAAAPVATADESVVYLSLDSADITAGDGTTFSDSETGNGAAGLRYNVLATAINIVQQPSELERVDTGFDLSVTYTDANGNLDLGADGDRMIVESRSDGGDVAEGTSLPAQDGIAAFASPNSVVLGRPGNTLGTLTLRLADDPSGSVDLSDGFVTTAPFVLVDQDDGDARLLVGSVLTEPTTIDSLVGSSSDVSVLDFEISDGGTSDALPTRVSEVHLQLIGDADAREHEWRLQIPDSADASGVVSGIVGAQTLSFTGLDLVVDDGSDATFVVALQLADTPANTLDGDHFALSLSVADLVVNAGTSFAASAPVTNGIGLVYGVVATELEIITQPQVVETVGEGIEITVAYVDANGNVDRDVKTDIITVLERSDEGAITRGTSSAAAEGIAVFTDASAAVLGAPGNVSGTLRLTLVDDTGGEINVSAETVDTVPFDLVNGDDSDAALSAGSLTEPATIDSVAGAADRVRVLDFVVADGGTSDGLDTLINDLVVRAVGSADASDHTWTLEGPAIGDDPAVTATVSGPIGDQIIVFSDLSSSVSDGTSETYTLYLQLAAGPLQTVDNSEFQLSLVASDVTTGAGTSLSSGSVSNGAGLTYIVTATTLGVVEQPGPTAEVDVPFDMQAGFVDSGGNIDRDVSSDVVSVTARSDAGLITASISSAAVEGIASFSGANQVELGAPGNVGGSLTLTLVDDAVGSRDFSSDPVATAPFILVDANDGDATIVAGPAQEPTSIDSLTVGSTPVFDFTIVDGGTSDGLSTEVTALVVRVQADVSASEHTWTLNGPGVTDAVGVVSSGAEQTVTFSGLSLSIADGASALFALSLDLDANPGLNVDNDRFVISISGDDATLGAGTSMRNNVPVGNGAGLKYDVVATEIRLLDQPTSTEIVGIGFNLNVEYTDQNGNRDWDVDGQTLIAERSDGGAFGQNTSAESAAGVASFGAENQVELGQPGNITGALLLTISDPNGDGIGLTDSFVDTSTFDLVALDDADATLGVGAGAEPSTIASVDGSEVPTTVLDFEISDGGVSDGLSTEISDIVVRVVGTMDASDHDWFLSGPDETGTLGIVGGIIGDQQVSFADLSISVPDGAEETYLVRVQLAASSAVLSDNDRFDVSIAYTDVTTAGGTSLDSGSAQNLGLQYVVDATTTEIVVQPGLTESVGLPFDVSVRFVDANANLDVDVNGDVLTALRSDGDPVSAGSSAPTSNGLASFTGVNRVVLDAPGNVDGTLALDISDDAAGAVDLSSQVISTRQFALINSDDADAQLLVGALVEPSGIDSVLATVGVDMFDFNFSDAGTSDGLGIDIGQIVVDLAGTGDGSEHTWLLNGPDATDETATVAGPIGNQTLTFADLSIAVADGSQDNYRLSVVTAFQPANTSDQQTFELSVDVDLITASGTSFVAGGTVTNGAGTTYDVEANEIRVLVQPTPNVQVDTGFDVSIGYTDVNGNLDTAVSGDVVTAVRSDGGAVNDGLSSSASSGIANFTGPNQIELGTPGDVSGTLQLVLTDDSAGTVNFSGAAITSNAFTLSNTNDGDAELIVSGTLLEPANIDSIEGSISAQQVLDFAIADGGTSDGLDTLVAEITVVVTGGADPSEHVWTLDGPDVSGATASVNGPLVTFGPLLIAVDDGSSETYVLSLALAASPANTLDGEDFDLSISHADIVSGGGTNFATSSVGNSPGLTYTVEATEVALLSQPADPAYIGVGFDLSVTYLDVNGNLDRTLSGERVEVTLRSDGGSVVQTESSGSSLGVASFSAGTQIVLGTPQDVTGTLTLTIADQSTGTLDLSSNSINTDVFDLRVLPDDDAVLTAGPTGEPATIAQNDSMPVAVFDVTITDGGAADVQPTGISVMVFDLSGTGDAEEHTWRLDGPDVTGVVGAVSGEIGAQTLTFSGLPVTIADNDSETYALSLNLATNPTNTEHRDTFIISLSTDNIALAVGSTTFGNPTSVSNGGLEYLNFSIATIGSDAGCEGGGTASVTVSGGRPAVSVVWAPFGQTTNTINDLTPGTYAVTVTDGDGEVLNDQVTIGATCSTACPNNNSNLGLIDLTAGECDGTVWEITPNLHGGDSFTLTVLEGVTYTVSTCNDPSPPAREFDSKISIYDTDSGDFVIFNDDAGLAACPLNNGWMSIVNFGATQDGSVEVVVDEWQSGGGCGGTTGNDQALITVVCQ